jgi:hypothetical protein
MIASLLEVALSIGGYYLLRALHVGVFWALTGPAIAVALVAAADTVRRRRTDMIGLLVLAELAVSIALSLITHSARVAAVREPLYLLVGGAFGLVTLLQSRPFTARTTASLAAFGDAKRTAAFERAWLEVPEYRRWQRILTAAIGVILVSASVIRVHLIVAAPADRLAHAVNVSNTVGVVMLVAVGVVSGVLIQRPRAIIERLLDPHRSTGLSPRGHGPQR